MSGYRRFVAYVYEYSKEKKGSNCGFVKVEVRGEVCRIELHLQCQGMLPESGCKVYGFVRNKGLLDGILLGECMTGEGRVECTLETPVKHMGNSDKMLDEMGGMVFVTEQGGFWGTEWDDQMIRPGNFRALESRAIQEEKQEEEEKQADFREDIIQEDQKMPEPKEKESQEELQEESQEESQELHTQSLEEAILPGTPCEAFADGELSDCRKISPQDLCRLGRRACMLRNNRFVQYGSCNFGHLLLCRNSCGQLLLGIPGGYDQQERFMANMFGFPYFKESQNIQIPAGKGGYWYRLIDSTNSNDRNSSQ